jgi:hypothetical protein
MSRGSRQTIGGEVEEVGSRRDFLKRSIAVAAAASMSDPSALLGQTKLDGITRPRANAAPAISRIVRVVSERVLPVQIVQPALLKDCIRLGLCAFTDEEDVRDAWHRILSPDDVILVKFNRSGAEQIGTTPAMVTELLSSLVAAGWGPDKIMVLESGPEVALVRKTRPADLRWQGTKVHFGESGSDCFIAALEEATALVNVPFLKTHHRATMTCCLKNLSHGLIRHPARFHANGCDPAIGEIVASEPIHTKLKVNIVNALRVPFDRGPDAGEGEMFSSGTLLVGTDPAACDATGYAILNEIRSLHGLGPLLPGAALPRQLARAAQLGLGRVDAEQIDVQRIDT